MRYQACLGNVSIGFPKDTERDAQEFIARWIIDHPEDRTLGEINIEMVEEGDSPYNHMF